MALIEELYKQGTINQEKRDALVDMLNKTGKTEEEVILENKIISEVLLFELKSKLSSIPTMKLSQKEIPLDVLELIPGAAAANYKMVPLFKKGNVVGIGMVYPENILYQNALRFLSRKENFSYETYLITFSDLENVLKQYRTLTGETKKALEELGKEKKEILPTAKRVLGPQDIIDEAPVIKMVFVILRHAIEGNASDVHIEPNREKLNVRFRQDGVLYPSLFLPLNVHSSIVSRVKIMANLKIDENRVPQDGRFSTKINEKDFDFRVATFPTLYGEKVEIRVLDPSKGMKPFEELGLRKKSLESIQEALKKTYGLILSCGPTGSGKTTTLYALMRSLNNESVNIVTIEDPVEYSMDGINQSQIRSEIGYTFAEGLRQILRQDPNIIMVGEIRDDETADLAINAALTGHIVLSTLHTNSAIGAIPRLIDMGIKPFLIPSTLRAVISQRLIRTLCQKCKNKTTPDERVKKYIIENVNNMPLSVKKEINITDPLYIWSAKGCEVCNFKGYKGRTGLFEVLPVTDALIDVISKDLSEAAILKQAKKQGMLTLAQEGIIKVLEGQTTIDEVVRVTEEK